MKIAGAEAIAIRIPLRHHFTIALGTLTHSNHVLVRMVDDEGRIGWGESTTFHAVYGYDQKSLYHVLKDYLIPAVQGIDPRNMTQLHQRMDQAIPFNLMAKCAIDLAAYDLVGQADGMPIYSLLGGKRVDHIPLTAALGIVAPAEAAARAKALAAKQFEVIKIKIGLDAKEDVERVKAVREAIGDTVTLRVDANQGYDRSTALRVLRQLEPLCLEWIEQPLASWDLEGLAGLCDLIDTPIAVDESVYTPYDAHRVIRHGAADVVNVKLPKCGGLYRSQKIAALCEGSGLPCFLGGCLETTPGTAAQAHFYTATANVLSAAEMDGPWSYVDDIVKDTLRMEAAAVKIPQAPGLGVCIDEDKINFYRVDY
jgi:o-succinylbenzoate synthase